MGKECLACDTRLPFWSFRKVSGEHICKECFNEISPNLKKVKDITPEVMLTIFPHIIEKFHKDLLLNFPEFVDSPFEYEESKNLIAIVQSCHRDELLQLLDLKQYNVNIFLMGYLSAIKCFIQLPINEIVNEVKKNTVIELDSEYIKYAIWSTMITHLHSYSHVLLYLKPVLMDNAKFCNYFTLLKDLTRRFNLLSEDLKQSKKIDRIKQYYISSLTIISSRKKEDRLAEKLKEACLLNNIRDKVKI